MGSSIQTITQQCTRLSSPPPSWPSPQLMLQLPLTTSPPHTRRRNSPLSHSPTSTELLMNISPYSGSLFIHQLGVSLLGIVDGSFLVVAQYFPGGVYCYEGVRCLSSILVRMMLE